MKVLWFAILLIACSVPLVAKEDPPAADSPKPATAATADAPATEGAMATIVIYRPKRFYGSGLTPSVYIDGEQVARLDNGRYFVVQLKPGAHKITSSMKHDPLEIETKADKIQFLEMVILTGNWRGGGRLIPTDSSDGLAAAKKLKPLDKQWVTSDHVTFALPEPRQGN